MALTDFEGALVGSNSLGDNRYEFDWFSGAQIGVMVGDVLIDNAVSIKFQADQNKTPVYGYANQYYSFLADGRVIVQGQLVIAFKEAGYLHLPITRFQRLRKAGQWTTPRFATGGDGVQYAGTSFVEAARLAKQEKTMRSNVEQIVNIESLDEADPNFKRKVKQNNRTLKQLGALRDDNFEKWAEKFEDALWFGSDTANPSNRDQLFSNNISDDKIYAVEGEDDEDVLKHRRLDQYPSVDIWITYGDINTQNANHTVKKLLDVSFVGQAQSIAISGEPIYEVYSFIARNLV